MKCFIKKLSTIALLGFVITSSVFAMGSHGSKGENNDSKKPRPTQNITVNDNYGVLIQDYNFFDGTLGSLTSVTKNSDNTYTLFCVDPTTRYYLADASGNPIGNYQVGSAFQGKSTWTLNADGKTSTIS